MPNSIVVMTFHSASAGVAPSHVEHHELWPRDYYALRT